MRTAFIERLHALAATDHCIQLVVGDLGYSVVEPFAESYPDRFLNAGVAEQNMTTVSAGMALGIGATVFTYSIANFSTMRCLEQIRNDVCYHGANVKVVIVGGGVAYGTHGYTHFAVEDIAVMRAMPGIVVAVPADPHESRALTTMATERHGPWYLRLGRNREPCLHAAEPVFDRPGQMLAMSGASDTRGGVILATGPILAHAIEAADKARAAGIEVSVWSVPFIKPFDGEHLRSLAKRCSWLLAVEEHAPTGGLGSAVAEALLGSCIPTPVAHASFPEMIDRSGSQDWLRSRYGIDSDGLFDRIRALHAEHGT